MLTNLKQIEELRLALHNVLPAYTQHITVLEFEDSCADKMVVALTGEKSGMWSATEMTIIIWRNDQQSQRSRSDEHTLFCTGSLISCLV